MRPKLTSEEVRLLRREAHGKGGLTAAGFITLTAAGREYIRHDDERVRQERSEAGSTRHIGERKRKQIARTARAARTEKEQGKQ